MVLKTGVIGYGKLGMKHTRNMLEHDKFDVVAISDVVKTANPNLNGVNFYTSHEQLIKNEDLDVVFVCVPHTKTKDITVSALEFGLDVFAEKPPGISLDETLDMKKALGDNVLQFGFNHRYYKHVQFLKQSVDNHKFGNLLWLRGLYGRTKNEGWRLKRELAGHGIFISQGVHLLDLVLWLGGHYNNKDTFDVAGSTVSSYKHSSWFEDNVFALLESDKGVTASIQSSCSCSHNCFNLWCQFENGWIELKGLNTSTKSFDFPECLIYGDNDDSYYYGNPPFKKICFEKDTSWVTEIDLFSKNVENHVGNYDCNVDEMVSLMGLVEKIYD